MHTTPIPSYKRHRFPTEIISYAVWVYFRFSLSYRDVEELLAGYCQVKFYETKISLKSGEYHRIWTYTARLRGDTIAFL